jgi:hypothetical protein
MYGLSADFRGRENNQAFWAQTPPFSGDFFTPMPQSLIIFPVQFGSVGFASTLTDPCLARSFGRFSPGF